MRNVLLATTLAVIGCTKQNPNFCPAHPDDPRCGMTDGGSTIDAPDSGPLVDARLSYGKGAYAILLTAPPGGPINFTGSPISTDGGNPCLATQVWVDTNQPPACFVVGTNITIPAASLLGVTGARPLVLVAADTITIAGTLDVASHIAATGNGPGAPDPLCGAGTAPGSDGNGGGGGAGGSFIGKGADGGGGNGSTTNGGKAAAAPATTPSYLRAGCNAQTGAAGGTGGAGGRGGGAVYLVAGNAINLSGGRINASGGAGAAGTSRAGGGGGGSGGMIVLYAPTITTDQLTKLLANGGGGGGGANGGAAGNDPDPANPLVGGIGGTAGGGCGTNTGGAGQASNAVGTGGSGPNNCGGGGGGGGIGYIQTNAALANGTFSPMPMVVQ